MQTIGEQLKQARISRDVTIAEAAKAIAIHARYLEALEADDFNALPSPVHTRGFLRNYAAYLGLDSAALLNQLRTITAPPDVFEKVDEEPAEPTAGRPEEGPPGGLVTEARPGSRTETESREPADGEGNPPALGPGLQDGEATVESPIEGAPPPSLEPEEGSDVDDDNFAEETQSVVDEGAVPLSRSIFLEIGQQLRQRRELLSLSLEEIERHTRIPRHHLQKLEAGDFELLSSPVQARGMLTSYARFIDLDSETVLLRFADAIQAQRAERHPLRPRRRPSQQRNVLPLSLRRFLSTDLVFGGGLVLAIAFFSIWGTARVITIRSQGQGVGHAQSISQVLLATQDTNPTTTTTPEAQNTGDAFAPPPPSAPAETATAFPTRFSTAPVELIVIANSRTWMRISVDGKTEFEGRTTPGAAYSFEAEEQIELLAADGGAVQLIYGRQNVGSPGGPGEVVNLIYTADAVLLPTPTITPSPTRTPRPSPTPRPTSTPRFTPVGTEPGG